tara:strand:- start:7577 stop:8281 length:705 start_codon:yes stop_codon:yes gene_type:complete
MSKENTRDLILERSLTTAIEKTIDQLDADGFDYYSDEVTGVDRPKIRIRKSFDQGGLNELVDLKTQGSIIPGQSLTNNPDKPYAWETPPEFTNPHEAIDYILSTLLEPETIKNISKSLTAGASLIDITNVILYSGFSGGKWTPDLMILLLEPTMYVLMAIAERLDVEYLIDNEDEDDNLVAGADVAAVLSSEPEQPEIFKEMESQIKEKDFTPAKIPKSILEKVEQGTKSLLGK